MICKVERTLILPEKAPILTGQTVHGPVVMLVGGRLVSSRPTARRAPEPHWTERDGFVA